MNEKDLRQAFDLIAQTFESFAVQISELRGEIERIEKQIKKMNSAVDPGKAFNAKYSKPPKAK